MLAVRIVPDWVSEPFSRFLDSSPPRPDDSRRREGPHPLIQGQARLKCREASGSARRSRISPVPQRPRST
jgi:hypothetical protein